MGVISANRSPKTDEPGIGESGIRNPARHVGRGAAAGGMIAVARPAKRAVVNLRLKPLRHNRITAAA
jgi:hypothetical protein